MIVTPFRARDYLEARAWSRLAGVPAEVVDPLTAAQTWEQGGPAYTGRLDGQVLACAGMLIPWPGLGHAWARISPLGRQHPRLVHFAIRRILGQTIAEQKIRRVEATVALDFDEGRRWIGLLGFEEDGVAKDYLPGGGDAMRYVLLVADASVQQQQPRLKLKDLAAHTQAIDTGRPHGREEVGDGLGLLAALYARALTHHLLIDARVDVRKLDVVESAAPVRDEPVALTGPPIDAASGVQATLGSTVTAAFRAGRNVHARSLA